MADSDNTLPIADPSDTNADVLGEIYDQLVDDDPPTIDD